MEVNRKYRVWILPALLTFLYLHAIGATYVYLFVESDMILRREELPLSAFVWSNFVLLAIVSVSAIVNWAFDKKYEEDPFLYIEIRPQNLFERSLCVLGSVFGVFIVPIFGAVFLTGFLAIFGIR